MEFDPIKDENENVRLYFDLDEIIAFQNEHEVQIIRGEDYQYACYIDGCVYAVTLTSMWALVYGIKAYKEILRKV
jgi:hypothetical protein